MRGYPDRSIGPVDDRGTPLGGVAQLLFNAEVSIPIVPQQFYGLIFADAGNAWGQSESDQPNGLAPVRGVWHSDCRARGGDYGL